MTKKISKYIKFIGNCATIVAVVFILKKMLSYNVNFGELILKKNNLFIFFMCMTAYIVNVLLSTIPWMNMVEIISGKKLPWKITLFVNVRANILKYIPGNIFQYVGKNELALKCCLNHFEVAAATVFDVVTMLTVAFFMGSFYIREYIFQILKTFINFRTFMLLSIVFLIILVALMLALKVKCFSLKNRIAGLLKRKENIYKLLVCVGYYVIQNLWVGIIYIAVLLMFLQDGYQTIPVSLILGANIISGVIGFLTPGAPGGIGIREMLMVIIAGGAISEPVIMAVSVIYRVLTIVGDGGAFIIASFIANKDKNIYLKGQDGIK